MLFHKPLSDMTNQEINALLALNSDAILDLQSELNLLKERGNALGQFRYKSAGKRVLYVGGENDKAAAYQALRKYDVHVVSPTTGEGSAADQAAAQYEFFDGYTEIYVAMDNDPKGREATDKIVKVLPANKVKIVSWSDKDCHKLLEDGRDEQIRRDFFNAKSYVDSGIKSSMEILCDVKEVLTAQVITLPS